MADTLPDINLVSTAFSNLYQGSGIAVGNPIIVVNKGTTAVYLVVKSTQPGATVTDGWPLPVNESAVIEQGASGAWARCVTGTGKVNVAIL